MSCVRNISEDRFIEYFTRSPAIADSSHYDKISDTSRSADPNRDPAQTNSHSSSFYCNCGHVLYRFELKRDIVRKSQFYTLSTWQPPPLEETVTTIFPLYFTTNQIAGLSRGVNRFCESPLFTHSLRVSQTDRQADGKTISVAERLLLNARYKLNSCKAECHWGAIANAGVENARVDRRGGKCVSRLQGWKMQEQAPRIGNLRINWDSVKLIQICYLTYEIHIIRQYN